MTFGEWYKANEAYLVTQPYTNYVAAAAWKAAQAEERERCAAIAREWGDSHGPTVSVNAMNAGSKIARAIEEIK